MRFDPAVGVFAVAVGHRVRLMVQPAVPFRRHGRGVILLRVNHPAAFSAQSARNEAAGLAFIICVAGGVLRREPEHVRARAYADVRPIADRILTDSVGRATSDITRGRLGWSNELALHLIEILSPTGDAV